MLDEMASALDGEAARNLMFAPGFAARMQASDGGLRDTVARAARAGIAVPALAAALGYFDMIRTARSTANLLQAQRDFFGAHGFARIDQPGAHHGPWGSHAPGGGL
jgi:6-phosphogluconate dehydrogenase